MKFLNRFLFFGVIAFVCLQFIRPSIPESPATAEWQAPPSVKHIVEKSCYSCHSNERRLAWFDQIVPAYWLVRHDILTAREHLNFQTLGSKPIALQKATLYEAVNMVQLGAMPLSRFRQLHPEANVTPQDLETLKAYLAPGTITSDQPGKIPTNSGAHTDAAPTASGHALLSLEAVQPEFNGISFDPSFESWKPLSMTDRWDNGSFRLIFGNDIAVRAARSGNVSPWPEGARFAKIAWWQKPGADGLIHPGPFFQVELMQKDANRYTNTDGWGWGRWRGLDLKPYGKDAHFVNECTGCHLPVRGNDYVYTLPITQAHVSGKEVVNGAAVLPASLPYQPLAWSALTLYVDPKNRTIATLYGNDAARNAAKGRSTAPEGISLTVYPPGAVLALVTWNQREDPHWFGGRIPDRPQSVEFVQVASPSPSSQYRRFAHSDLGEVPVNTDLAAQRMNFILTLPPAQLP